MSNSRFYLTVILALLSFQASAADDVFVDAEVINIESKQGLTSGAGIFNAGLESDNYTEVTLQLGDIQVSARTYSMGGGIIYLANHPEALIVGSTVQARIAKRGVLEVQVPPKGKLLKFNIERMEKI